MQKREIIEIEKSKRTFAWNDMLRNETFLIDNLTKSLLKCNKYYVKSIFLPIRRKIFKRKFFETENLAT